jgi:hypothetical protein
MVPRGPQMQGIWKACGKPGSPYLTTRVQGEDSKTLQWVCDQCAASAKIQNCKLTPEDALCAEVMLS